MILEDFFFSDVLLQTEWEYDIISTWNEVSSKIAKRTPFRGRDSKGGFSHVR